MSSIKGNSDIVDMLLNHGATGDAQDKVLIYSWYCCLNNFTYVIYRDYILHFIMLQFIINLEL